MNEQPVCGWCGWQIEGATDFDPRGAGPGGEERLCHPACAPKLREALAKMQEQAVDRVLRACKRVHDAYHAFGPVDDGRPEGDEFEAALDELIGAAIEAGVKMTDKKKRKRKPKGA